MKIFQLKREREEALAAANAVVSTAENGSRDMTAAETQFFDGYMKTAKDLTDKLEAHAALNTLKAGPNGFFGMSPELQPAAAPNSLREAMNAALPAEREEFRSFARYLGGDATALADLRPSGDGGVFIPTAVAGVVARNYASFTPVRSAATLWPTANGEPTQFPVISDSETAVILAPASATGADSTVSGNAPPTAISGVLMEAYKFSSKPVFFPRELTEDSEINVIEEVLSALLARIARTQNLKYTKGAGVGSGEPSGFLTTSTAYAAGAVPLDLDIALDLAYSVPALYRPGGIYMASDSTIKYLRKLKTGVAGDKRNLWKDVFEEGNATLGTPAKLHGYPIFVNNDMDSVAADGTFAGVSPLVFGDFKRFVIREVGPSAPYVYRYPVPALDGGAVIAFSRSDSKLIVPTAISKLTVS